MKNLQNYKKFNEEKISIVNFSDLHDSFSAEYHVSDELNNIKKDIKILGTTGIKKKLISLIKKIGEVDYKEAVKYAKKKYNKNITTYERALKVEHWNNSNISDLIVVLGSIESSIEITKEKIVKDIETLKNRLENLNK